MKILYVASTWRHLLHFHIPYVQELCRRGHIVHAAAGGKRQDFPWADLTFSFPLRKKMASLKNFTAARNLASRIREENYDLIAVHTSLAAFFVRLAVRLSGTGCPVCNTVHGYLFDGKTPFLKRRLLLQAEKMMASVTDTVVVMANEDYEIAQRHKLYRRKLHYIKGMGVDFSRFSPITPFMRREAREKLSYREEDFVLVFAGEFSERKNQPMLIEAMTKLPPQVKLLLLGEGAEMGACQILAAKRGVSERIRFEGYQENTPLYYAASDICVSSSRSEGLPFNLMEAMGMGLPVIATAVKGHTDLVEPGRGGLLVPFNDADAFARAVRELMEEPQQRDFFGANNAAAREQYSLKAVLPAHIAVYEEILSDKKAP